VSSKYIRPPNSIVLAWPLYLRRVKRDSLGRSYQNDTRPVFRPGKRTENSLVLTGKFMACPCKALCPWGSTISFMKAWTLQIGLFSVTLRQLSSGGTGATCMLLTTERRDFSFREVLQWVHNHTLSSPSIGCCCWHNHAVAEAWHCHCPTYEPPLGYVYLLQL